MAESLETVVVHSDRIDIPADIKKKLHVKKGDRIRWTYEGDRLVAEVIKKKKGTLSALVGKFTGEPSDSVRTQPYGNALMEAFVDSVVLIGAFYRNDQWHAKAAPIIREIDSGHSPVYITDFILAEVLNFLHQKAGHGAATETLRALESSETISIIRVSDSQFAAGNAFFEKYPRLSFVDALTVACMKDVGIENIYSFDSDFDGIEGVVRLEKPVMK